MKKVFISLLIFFQLFAGKQSIAQPDPPCGIYDVFHKVIPKSEYDYTGTLRYYVPTMSSGPDLQVSPPENQTLLYNCFYHIDETNGKFVNFFGVVTSNIENNAYGEEGFFNYGVGYDPAIVYREVSFWCRQGFLCPDPNQHIPATNPNNPANNWSSALTWVDNAVPGNSESTILLNKATNLDVNLSLSGQLLISNTGSGIVAAGITFADPKVLVRPSGLLQNNGTLAGMGKIAGSLTNNGIIAPGNPPGFFAIKDNYTATANAIHLIEIAGANSNDTIRVGGVLGTTGGLATLNGILTISLSGGYVPALGDTYTIFNFSSATGTFSQTNFPGLPAGLYWKINYNATNITLAVTDIPECSTPLLWYKDADNDGYSDGSFVTQCVQPSSDYKLASSLIATGGDCDDHDATIHPGAFEIIGCPAPRSVISSPPYCLATLPDFTTAVVLSGNCGNMNQLLITQSPVAGSQASGITTVTITVSDALGNHTNCLTTFTVTGSVPTRPSAITAEAGYSNVCSIVGTSTSVRYSVTQVSAYTYNWTIPQHTIIDSGSHGNKIRLRFLAGYIYDVNDSLKVRAVSSCGVGVLYRALAIKSTLPAVPSSTTGFTLCGPGVATVKATAITGNTIDWYDGSGALLQIGVSSGSNSYNSSITATTVFYAACRNLTTGCSSARVPVTVTVNPLPNAPVVSSVTSVCSHGTSTITIVPIQGVSFSLYAAATGGTAIKTGNPIITGNLSITTTYYIVAKNTGTGCVSATRTAVTVIVYPVPSAPVVPAQRLCGSGSVTFIATAGTDEVVDWYSLDSGPYVLLATGTTSFTTPELSASTTYYAFSRSTVTGCVSVAAPAVVNFSYVPNAPVINPFIQTVTPCGPGNVKIIVYVPPGITLDWYNAFDNSLLKSGTSSGDNILNAYFTVTTPVNLVSRNLMTGCVASATPQIDAVVNGLPTAPNVESVTAICTQGAATITVTPMPNITNNLFSSATGGTAIISGNALTTPVISTSRNYFVESKDNLTGCVSTRTVATIPVNPPPPAPTVAKTPVCGDNYVTFTGSVTAGNVVDWYRYLSATSSVLVRSASDTYTTNFIVHAGETPQFFAVARNLLSGCISARSYIFPTVNSIPSSGTISINNYSVHRCGPGSITLSASSQANTIDWYAADGTLLQAGTSSGTNLFTKTITATTYFYVTTRNRSTGCFSEKLQIVGVVDPKPGAPVVEDVSSVCTSGSAIITLTNVQGVTNKLYSNINGGYALATGVLTSEGDEITTPVVSASTAFYIEARTNLTGCYASSRTPVTVLVNAAPAPPLSQGDIARCGSGLVTLSVINPPGETVEWYTAASGNLVFIGPDYSVGVTASKLYYAASRTNATGCLSLTRTPVKALVSTRLPNAPGVITGPTDICLFLGTGTAVYSIPAVSYATSYDWIVPAGATIVSGAGTTSITVSFTNLNPAGDIISVNSRSGCGVSATSSSLAVNINACPPIGKGGRVPVATNVQVSPKIEAIPVKLKTDAVLYPNPSQGNFNVRIKTKEKTAYGILLLIGVNGNIISSKKVTIDMERMLITNINTEGLAPGIYQVRYIIGSKTGVLKAVIIK